MFPTCKDLLTTNCFLCYDFFIIILKTRFGKLIKLFHFKDHKVLSITITFHAVKIHICMNYFLFVCIIWGHNRESNFFFYAIMLYRSREKVIKPFENLITTYKAVLLIPLIKQWWYIWEQKWTLSLFIFLNAHFD